MREINIVDDFKFKKRWTEKFTFPSGPLQLLAILSYTGPLDSYSL